MLRVKLHSDPALNYPPLAQPIARTELLEHLGIFGKTCEIRDTLGKLACCKDEMLTQN